MRTYTRVEERKIRSRFTGKASGQAPGIIDTEVWDEVLPPDAKLAQFEAMESSLPVGRVGTPDDVAQALEFLITNDFVTGTAIEIDGGYRIT